MPKGSGWFLASGLCPRVSAGRRVSTGNVLMAGLVGGIWTPKPRVGLVTSSGVIRRPTLAITFTGRLPLHPEDPARGLAGTWLRSVCEATCVECPTAAVTNGHERSGFRQRVCCYGPSGRIPGARLCSSWKRQAEAPSLDPSFRRLAAFPGSGPAHSDLSFSSSDSPAFL